MLLLLSKDTFQEKYATCLISTPSLSLTLPFDSIIQLKVRNGKTTHHLMSHCQVLEIEKPLCPPLVELIYSRTD
jgi:hypothetical protein